MQSDEEIDENYDALRQKNISRRNAFFAEFFKDLKKETNEIKKEQEQLREKNSIENDLENQPPRKRRKIFSANSKSFKGGKIRFEFRRKYNTRNSTKRATANENNDFEKDDEDLSKSFKSHRSKLKVMFPWAKPFQRTIDLMKMDVCDVDEEEEVSDDDAAKSMWKRHRMTKSEYEPDNVPSTDEVTEEMLKNVVKKSSLKTYCKIKGTSCHQCRQKTLDTKTICRSGECIGIRGQFCGSCLQGRYGEDAVKALKDPDWACPPCRGLCNCSICRTKDGLQPTGILAPIVQEIGYSSVMDYLQITEQ